MQDPTLRVLSKEVVEFHQIDSALQRRATGTGLGLPLSRRLAELLGGSLMVESTPGVGSTFYLTIPMVYPGDETADIRGAASAESRMPYEG